MSEDLDFSFDPEKALKQCQAVIDGKNLELLNKNIKAKTRTAPRKKRVVGPPDNARTREIIAEYSYNFNFYEKIKNASIFIDLKALRFYLKRASLMMEKANRITYCDPAIASCTTNIHNFILAYNDEINRDYYIYRLGIDFITLRLDCEDILESKVINKNDIANGYTVNGVTSEIIMRLGKLDDAISKFSIYKRNKAGSNGETNGTVSIDPI